MLNINILELTMIAAQSGLWDNLDQYVTLNCHTIPLQYNCDQYVTLKLQPVPDY